MSFVIAAPEMMTAAASDVANIGSTLSAANAAAAAPTTGIVAAAGDEVSAAIAAPPPLSIACALAERI